MSFNFSGIYENGMTNGNATRAAHRYVVVRDGDRLVLKEHHGSLVAKGRDWIDVDLLERIGLRLKEGDHIEIEARVASRIERVTTREYLDK